MNAEKGKFDWIKPETTVSEVVNCSGASISETIEAVEHLIRIRFDYVHKNPRVIANASRFAECLQRLADLQNGPPLIKYEKDWSETMEEAQRLLDLVQEKLSSIEDFQPGDIYRHKNGQFFQVIGFLFSPERIQGKELNHQHGQVFIHSPEDVLEHFEPITTVIL